ncbi:hypothetical protein DFH08DRAFT_854918 [Mycena albidolilacea]|uniref:DUF6533 domain-containing protein n=1 Tax=Mycena albidolilacea TaxID=1033008 RepID=A0AAD7ABR5_9AGAR|nr:hypothetical protein DFH08DRAFT_854918 [Mycena albidolilacea]
MSDDAGVPELIHVVNVAQTYIACTTSILVWDWLSCLPQEWRCIWSRPGWSPIKILYCLVRYYTLLVLVVTDVWFFADWSESSCARYVRILPGIAVLIDVSVELVLALRVYALYGCTKTIGAFLLLLIAGFLGVMIAVPILAFDYTRFPSWPGPCIVTGKPSIAGPKFIIAFYASPMVFDIIMTTLTVYKVMDHNRHGGSSSLLNRMVRDGIFYFVAITSLNLLNVIFFIQPNTLIQAINAPMSIQISSVLCCRLILNLRTVNEAKNNVRKYSNTRGRWVTEIIRESEDPDTIQFTAQSRNESSFPGALDSDVRPPTPDGILVHFERQVHSDQLQKGGERKSIGRVPPV